MAKRIILNAKDLLKKEPTPVVQRMIGKTFGRLTVLSYAGYRKLPSGFDYHYVWCKCCCGKKILGSANHINNNKWKSCGCLVVDFPNRFKHGYATTSGTNREKIYVTWQGIHKRTGEGANNDKTRNYYEKGIKVCEGWSGEDGFVNFKKDMLPITDKSIDRIDNDLHYSCGHCEECKREGWKLNCRWGNDDIQSNNRGGFNNWITIDSTRMTYRQADRHLGFPIKTLQTRIKVLGWTEEKAITTPITNNKTRHLYK